MYEKGVRLYTVDYERVFRHLSTPPIMVNDFDLASASERERLNNLLYSRYDGDTLSNIPKCDCGKTTGAFNLNRRCLSCGTLVEVVTEKPLESLLWMEAPKGIPGFPNLTVWRILSKWMTHSGFNLLEYMTNPYYRANVKPTEKIRKFDDLGLPMGLCNFHDHYDEIIETLYKHRFLQTGNKAQRELMEYLQSVRDITFTRHLPFPSKLLFITEKSNKNIYSDYTMAPAVEAILTLASMYSGQKSNDQESFEEPDIRMKESRCIKTVVQLDSFYKSFESKIAFKKPGIFRKLVFGVRPHWTFRAVISSQHKPHRYDELEIPWSLAVLLFKTHLSNKLLKRNFTPNDIVSLLYENTLKHHLLLESLFNELLEEAPGGSIPTLYLRNPTLRRASMQCLKISKVKTDPSINSVSFSVLCLKGPNADFDGDAMSGQPMLDTYSAEQAQAMAPYTGVMDLNRPHRVSRNVAHPTPFLSTLMAWMKHGDEISEPRT